MATVRLTRRLLAMTRPPGGRTGRTLALSTIVDSVGRGVFLAGSVVFFTRSVGLSPTQVGAGLGIAGVVGLIATFPVGLLVDRWGARRVLVALQFYRAFTLAAYAVVDTFGGFVIVASLVAVGAFTAVPVLQSLVGAAVPAAERVVTMGYLRAVQNAGFATGGALAAAAIAVDTRTGYLVLVLGNATSFLLSAAILAGLPGRRPAGRPVPGRRSGPWAALRDRPFLAAAALNGVLALNASLLVVGVPLWILTHGNLAPVLVAIMFVLNTLLAVSLQVPVSATAATAAGSSAALRRAGLALAACCVLLVVTARLDGWLAVAVLAGAVIALTFGEMLQSAGAWSACYALAPAQRRGSYLAAFNLGVNGQNMAGPVIVTAAVTVGAAGWVALGAIFAAAGVAAGAVVDRAVEGRPDPDAAQLVGARG